MSRRKTDLAVDSLWLVYALEDGGAVNRLLDWDQLNGVTTEDRRSVEKYGWEEGYMLEALWIDTQGQGHSVWVCGPEELAQCKADASSGVIFVYGMS